MKDIFKIRLDILDASSFLKASNSIPNDVCVYQDNIIASGKSIMGVYALDLSKSINLIVRDRENDDIVYEKFGKWIIQE